MTSACCVRFAEFHQDPGRRYRSKHRLDLDALSLSPDGERRVTVTMRGLFLDRELTVQHESESIFDAALGHHLPRFSHDTYLGGLGLSAAEVLLVTGGGKVLDVASGLAAFATEMSSLGAHVDCVDRELVGDHPSFQEAARHLRSSYPTELELLGCLARHSKNPRYELSPEELGLLDRVESAAAATARDYPKTSGQRLRGDATALSVVPRATYDLVTCAWLMVHLMPEQERAVFEGLVAATKVGGRVHVRCGYGGEVAPRLSTWFPGGRGPAWRVEVDPRTRGDLAVLVRVD